MPYLIGIDWDKMVEDVVPFLISLEDADKIRLFPKFVKQKLFE